MNGHERILLLAAAAIDFSLDAGEVHELEAHLQSCDVCRSAAANLRGDAALIASLPRRQPSDEVGRRVVEAALGQRRTGSRPILVLVAAALLLAAALLGAAIVGSLLPRTRELPVSQVPPSPQATGAASVAPTATPAATATPAPTNPPGETWQVVTPVGSPGMSGVAAGGPGWVGVGGGAWTSADGRTWTPATAEGIEPCPGPDRCSGMTEVAAGVGGFVAIGEDPTALGSWLIWHSPDGLDWKVVGSGPDFELGACIEGCPSMTDVAGGPMGFVAIGYRTGGAQVAWFSSDGLRWEALPAKTFEAAGFTPSLAAAAAGPSGFVVAGSITAGGSTGSVRPAFWTSPDGRAWTRTGPDAASKPSAVPYAVVSGGPGFVAVGGCRDVDKPCAVAWLSPDGMTWTQQTIDASESPRLAGPGASGEAAATDGDRVIAFSDAGTAVWTSDDGLAWAKHEVAAEPLFFEAVAGGEHGFIAMGLDIAETAYYTWLSP